MGLAEAVRGQSVYLDTNVFVYALEEHPAYAEAVRGALKRV